VAACSSWPRRRWGTPLGGGLLGIGLLGRRVSNHLGQPGDREPRRRPQSAQSPRPFAPSSGCPVTVCGGSDPGQDLNQHSFTHARQRNGDGSSAAKQATGGVSTRLILRRPAGAAPATGDQGTTKGGRLSRRLALQVRSDPTLRPGRQLAMERGAAAVAWQRRAQAPSPRERFEPASIRLAQGLEAGPSGLAAVFERDSPHTSSNATSSTEAVSGLAEARLKQPPNDESPLEAWPLLAVFAKNRPVHGRRWFSPASRGSNRHQPLAVRPTRSVSAAGGWNLAIPCTWRPRRRPGQPRSSASPCLRPSPISPEALSADPRACAKLPLACRSPLNEVTRIWSQPAKATMNQPLEPRSTLPIGLFLLLALAGGPGARHRRLRRSALRDWDERIVAKGWPWRQLGAPGRNASCPSTGRALSEQSRLGLHWLMAGGLRGLAAQLAAMAPGAANRMAGGLATSAALQPCWCPDRPASAAPASRRAAPPPSAAP